MRSPVIVISLRYDRLDWFWHTVLHELARSQSGWAARQIVGLPEKTLA